jgi:hypothetical protein
MLRSRLVLPISLAAFLAAAGSPHCFGFAEIARGALLLRTTGSATYDSYFLGTTSNDADVIYTVYPALEYSRRAGRAQLFGSAGMAVNRYDENSDLDSEDLRLNGSVTMPTAEGSRLEGSFGLSYNEATVVDLFVNDRVPTKSFSANLNFDYKLSSRMTLSETLSYGYTLRELYSDQELLSNQIELTYDNVLRDASLFFTHTFTRTASSGDNELRQDLDQFSNSISVGLSKPIYGDVRGRASVGYSLFTDSAGDAFERDRDKGSAFVELGIDGPFLPRNRFPKLKSSASLSYQQSQRAGIGDTAGRFLGGNLSLAWEARQRTQLYIRGSRSIDLTVSDFTVERTQISGGFNQQIGLSIGVNGSVGYSWNDFRGRDRTDNVLDANLGAGKAFNKYLSVGANYTFQQVENSGADVIRTRFSGRDYTRHVATGSITVTF